MARVDKENKVARVDKEDKVDKTQKTLKIKIVEIRVKEGKDLNLTLILIITKARVEIQATINLINS